MSGKKLGAVDFRGYEPAESFEEQHIEQLPYFYIQPAISSVQQSKCGILVFDTSLEVNNWGFDGDQKKVESSKDSNRSDLKLLAKSLEMEPYMKVHCARLRIAACIAALTRTLAFEGLELDESDKYSKKIVSSPRVVPTIVCQKKSWCDSATR